MLKCQEWNGEKIGKGNEARGVKYCIILKIYEPQSGIGCET